jgi:hypothetical protein
MFLELLSGDRETGNPLVLDAACGAELSGAQRARIRWVSFVAQLREKGLNGKKA